MLTKDYSKWNFETLQELIEGPLLNLKRMEEAIKVSKFIHRLMSFSQPFGHQFSDLLNVKVVILFSLIRLHNACHYTPIWPGHVNRVLGGCAVLGFVQGCSEAVDVIPKQCLPRITPSALCSKARRVLHGP